jgi:hypothetical protein
MNDFVVKLKLGRYFVKGLGLVEVPIGISRLKRGAWSISATRFPDISTRLFNDADYKKGAVASLLAALDAVHSYETKRLRALETEEREIKVMKLNIVGVCYYEYDHYGVTVHRFGVSTPGDANASVSVYIGNDNTVLANWDSALATARDLRHAWERQRNIDSYWDGLRPIPMNDPLEYKASA